MSEYPKVTVEKHFKIDDEFYIELRQAKNWIRFAAKITKQEAELLRDRLADALGPKDHKETP